MVDILRFRLIVLSVVGDIFNLFVKSREKKRERREREREGWVGVGG
jgi:hypothetical protein